MRSRSPTRTTPDRLAEGGSLGGRGWFDVAMVVAMTILALVLGALTLRRRTP